MHRRLAACLLAAAAVVGGLVTAPAAQAGAAPLRYVALGDSYSAASGVLPPDPLAPPACLRSIRDYPHVIAHAIGARLTDVTCAGARTKDFSAAQHLGVAPQLNAVRADTELVTMTIGGNDSGVFAGSVVACSTAALPTLGRGSPCKHRYGSSFEDTIRTTTYPVLVSALRAVREKAPGAEVAILGYPWVLPETGGCYDRMPVAAGDVPYLRGIQAALNDAVRRAAEATGVTYVDMTEVSNGHDVCRPRGVRWIEPVLRGTNAVVLHPNALGEAGMAARAMAVLGLG